MENGIYIGADKKSIEILGKVIMEILNSKQEQETIRVALQTLSSGTTIANTSISGCSVSDYSKDD